MTEIDSDSRSNSDSSTVELSPEAYSRVESRVENSDFNDTAAYVEFVLMELIDRLERNNNMTEDDEEVRDRLRELGYIE